MRQLVNVAENTSGNLKLVVNGSLDPGTIRNVAESVCPAAKIKVILRPARDSKVKNLTKGLL